MEFEDSENYFWILWKKYNLLNSQDSLRRYSFRTLKNPSMSISYEKVNSLLDITENTLEYNKISATN